MVSFPLGPSLTEGKSKGKDKATTPHWQKRLTATYDKKKGQLQMIADL